MRSDTGKTCNWCGKTDLRWQVVSGKWRLFAGDTEHACSTYRPRKPARAFLRWYGPRTDRTNAVLVEKPVDVDTPAGFYFEPTKSSFEQVEKVRNA